MRFALRLSYKGTHYHGWQLQENANTVQAEIEKALATLFQTNMEIAGCGRTDTGVHARDYVAHFDTDKPLPDRFLNRINSLLPTDISVSDCWEVQDNFNARFDAKSREYSYYIHCHKNPFSEEISWQRNGELNIEKMNQAAQLLIGKKAFACFCKGEPPNGSYICDVSDAAWIKKENQYIFTISANRFLRNMVRAIVGTMVEIGTDKMSIESFKSVLDNGARSDAGQSVPAHGLFLEKVEYELD